VVRVITILKPTTAATAEVTRVRELVTGLDPVVLAVALVQYADTRDADDALLVAIALALEIANLRRPNPFDDYPGGRYHRNHPLPKYTELQRLRYPPTGDRDEWVRNGATS
jgi:hypothetical protein